MSPPCPGATVTDEAKTSLAALIVFYNVILVRTATALRSDDSGGCLESPCRLARPPLKERRIALSLRSAQVLYFIWQISKEYLRSKVFDIEEMTPEQTLHALVQKYAPGALYGDGSGAPQQHGGVSASRLFVQTRRGLCARLTRMRPTLFPTNAGRVPKARRWLFVRLVWLLERHASGGVLSSRTTLGHARARLLREAPWVVLRQNADERLRRALHVAAWVVGGLVTTDELAREVARYEARGRTGGEREWQAVVEASAAVAGRRRAALQEATAREPLWKLATVGARNLRTELLRNTTVRSSLPFAFLRNESVAAGLPPDC